ncbi:hypothetical protein Tco_0378526 [Tanacetum coccineum]
MKRLITNETTEEWGIKLFRLAATVVLNTNVSRPFISEIVRYLSDNEATKRMIVDRWFHTDDIGYMELIKYKGFQVSPAELDALLVTHSKVQPLLLSCTRIAARMMEVFMVSYKPQMILTNSDGSVCSLLKKRIPDVHDSQFVSDVREPLEIEELMDQDVGKLALQGHTEYRYQEVCPKWGKMLRKQLDQDIAKAERYVIAQGIIFLIGRLNRGIASVAIIDRQLPFEYTIASRSTDVMVMALPVLNINHSAFMSMFEREKLSGSNFNDWFLALGWHLEEIHVTWAHLEKKQTRLRTYIKSLVELCIQRVETASQE